MKSFWDLHLVSFVITVHVSLQGAKTFCWFQANFTLKNFASIFMNVSDMSHESIFS